MSSLVADENTANQTPSSSTQIFSLNTPTNPFPSADHLTFERLEVWHICIITAVIGRQTAPANVSSAPDCYANESLNEATPHFTGTAFQRNTRRPENDLQSLRF
jgi:hypothetical protein